MACCMNAASAYEREMKKFVFFSIAGGPLPDVMSDAFLLREISKQRPVKSGGKRRVEEKVLQRPKKSKLVDNFNTRNKRIPPRYNPWTFRREEKDFAID